MKIIGDKLRIARQIRNKTITDLAKEINISKQALSQFEKGESEPKTETLFNLARTLKFPLGFFTTPYNVKIVNGNTFFRSLRTTTALSKSNYVEKTKMLLVIYDLLNEYLDLPELDLPKISLEYLAEINIEGFNYEMLAQEVRKAWGLNNRPIWNMVDLLEQHGIIMSVLKDESDKIDAFTFTDDTYKKRRYCVMLENEKNSMARRNFSVAHELGHILLHSFLNLDELESYDETILEKQANFFAASFLLPKEEFIKDLQYPKEYRNYVLLKEKWHVSMKAMFNRAKELGKISQEEYVGLLKKYNYYISKANPNGEKIEPLDDEITIDKPELFETALKILFEEKVFENYRAFADKLNEIGCAVDMEMLYSILSLSKGFFDKYNIDKPIVVSLKKK